MKTYLFMLYTSPRTVKSIYNNDFDPFYTLDILNLSEQLK